MAEDTGTYQEYWQAVRDCAASAVSDIGRRSQAARSLEAMGLSEDWPKDVDLSDRVHELVDGSQWVIYTWRNLRVLQYTAHFDAYEDEGGLHSDKAFRTCYQVRGETSLSTQSLSSILTVSAYYAMHADVYAEIARLED